MGTVVPGDVRHRRHDGPQRQLVRWIDKAAANGAIHRNTAARKKAQAAKLVSGSSS